ncbi:hypothetical protein [Levilactobacillus angrenensis]|uniref:Uncharacterized protein n=1 Tax=Levilactobacillus angrenensis TaxID=2486020 RepID=A0ABW1U920_9LACO|nr:hypothetical protein [Levilactobacillus angrenensis]
MSRLTKWLVGLVGLLLIGGLIAVVATSHHQSPSPTTQSAATHPSHHQSTKLTTNDLAHHPKLAYSAIIYYAIKEPKLQRWQEVNDFQAGWQVEHYATKHPTRYLVWPNQHVTTADKNLAPNWFSLQGDRVTYDSMIVHSFRQDQTATTTLSKIVKRINAQHAAQKVRQMPAKMSVLNHQ